MQLCMYMTIDADEMILSVALFPSCIWLYNRPMIYTLVCDVLSLSDAYFFPSQKERQKNKTHTQEAALDVLMCCF